MDSAISTAARALSVADPLTALQCVALRSDAAALALRGIAMAQLGEFSHAKVLLGRAARKFGEREPIARARCVVAAAEVELATRNLARGHGGLEAAASLLGRRGDRANAAFARLVQVRRWTLLGEVERAKRVLDALTRVDMPARLLALSSLAAADLALRRADASGAQQAFARAHDAARRARIPPLVAEVEKAAKQLAIPVARVREQQRERPLLLRELPAVWASGKLVIDACRREVRVAGRLLTLVTRPILFELLLALGEAAPGDVARDALIARVFAVKRSNDSHRVRLRVELGRLRRVLRPVAEVRATARGFELVARDGRECCLLLPPGDNDASALLGLLGGGEAWATSALALALGRSQRAVQRALGVLEREGKVRSVGAGRARRWIAAPSAGFATTLLLVAREPLG